MLKTIYQMTSRTTILIAFLLSSIQLFAQKGDTEARHPIDIRLENCHSIDSNQTTYGMINCEIIARDEWDKELNKYYNLLMDILGAEERTKLKNSQLAWLSYRDKEKDFSGTMYYNMQGTMWHVVAAGRFCEMVRQRALELKEYYDTLTFGN